MRHLMIVFLLVSIRRVATEDQPMDVCERIRSGEEMIRAIGLQNSINGTGHTCTHLVIITTAGNMMWMKQEQFNGEDNEYKIQIPPKAHLKTASDVWPDLYFGAEDSQNTFFILRTAEATYLSQIKRSQDSAVSFKLLMHRFTKNSISASDTTSIDAPDLANVHIVASSADTVLGFNQGCYNGAKFCQYAHISVDAQGQPSVKVNHGNSDDDSGECTTNCCPNIQNVDDPSSLSSAPLAAFYEDKQAVFVFIYTSGIVRIFNKGDLENGISDQYATINIDEFIQCSPDWPTEEEYYYIFFVAMLVVIGGGILLWRYKATKKIDKSLSPSPSASTTKKERKKRKKRKKRSERQAEDVDSHPRKMRQKQGKSPKDGKMSPSSRNAKPIQRWEQSDPSTPSPHSTGTNLKPPRQKTKPMNVDVTKADWVLKEEENKRREVAAVAEGKQDPASTTGAKATGTSATKEQESEIEALINMWKLP